MEIDKYELEINLIKQKLKLIQDRNKKVEIDKAWEKSFFRISSICFLTYIIASIALYLIGVKEYLLNALIPTIGYFLSTQSLPIMKKWWLNRLNNHEK